MKPIILIAVVAIVVVAAAAVLLVGLGTGGKMTNGPVACTMDARICPDGSAVGRVAPNCEFAPCPEVGSNQCECPTGYRKDGDACNPECYYSTPPCLAPSVPCSPLVGNDFDEHGCKGSAGYSWCEAKQKCLRAWEEPCTEGCVPDPAKACTMDYTPVCGKDGVTYGNRCAAEAVCAEIAYAGECGSTGGTGGALGGGTGMANPASVYCEEQGGTLEIVDTPEGQVGMCHFANGQVCEEWALFRSNATNCTGADGSPAKTYCQPEQRGAEICTMEYRLVCGWAADGGKKQTYSNPCGACIQTNVAYWTEGEC